MLVSSHCIHKAMKNLNIDIIFNLIEYFVEHKMCTLILVSFKNVFPIFSNQVTGISPVNFVANGYSHFIRVNLCHLYAGQDC
jgi:hypothetical protein